jgi:aminocarboxymuconate-semialdehyde decarboxylase
VTIDVHAHYLPESAVRAEARNEVWHGTSFERGPGGVPVAQTGDRRFVFGSPVHFEPMADRVALMDARRVDTEVLSLLPPLFRYYLPRSEGAAAARALNDELSDLTQRFPGRFLGLATVPLQDVDAAVAELERASRLPGLVGVTVGTHVNGENLDAPGLAPFWSAAQALRSFVFIHPIGPRDRGALDSYYLRNVIGNPLETTIAASSLMLSGRLDEMPDVTVCLAHGGGYTCTAVGRMDWAHQARGDASSGTASRPRDLYRRFLYDSLTHSDLGLRQLVDSVGADRVVLGTDFPADMGRTDAVAELQASTSFSTEEKEAILSGNLQRCLPVDVPVVRA